MRTTSPFDLAAGDGRPAVSPSAALARVALLPTSAALAVLVAFATLAAPGPLAAQETPEREPPAAAGEAAGAHTVRPGETLWDLASRFLSDPLRWPAIFEANPEVVEDPHWIYPGEELRIPGGGARRVDRVQVERAEDFLANVGRRDTSEAGTYPAGSVFRQPREGDGGLSRLSLEARPPLPALSPDDLRSAPLLVRPGELGPEAATVRVMEENPLDLRLPTGARRHTDVVLALGVLRPEVGDSLKAIRHERTEGVYEVVVPKALVQVRRLWADSARATVVQVYGDYAVGDPLIGTSSFTLDPAARPLPAETEIEGRVLALQVPQVLLGPGEMVFLDVGGDAGVRLGDDFAVFSRTEREATDGGPDDALAVLRIVHVTPTTSTARVTDVRDPGTRLGDPVRLIRRLAVPASEGDAGASSAPTADD